MGERTEEKPDNADALATLRGRSWRSHLWRYLLLPMLVLPMPLCCLGFQSYTEFGLVLCLIGTFAPIAAFVALFIIWTWGTVATRRLALAVQADEHGYRVDLALPSGDVSSLARFQLLEASG